MDQQKSVFRKKSLERISSPEQLNDYIKVASPGKWMILVGVIIFLVGVCVWGVLGKLEFTIKAPVLVDRGYPFLFVSVTNINDIEPGVEVTFGKIRTKVHDIGSETVEAGNIGGDYFLNMGNFSADDRVYICPLELTGEEMRDGIYEARVIAGSASPMSFVTN